MKPEHVALDVATVFSLAGVPLVVVQYASWPAVSLDDVETAPVAWIVTAPVAPEIVTFDPATIDVTPELVMDGETEPTTVKDEHDTPDEQEALDVETDCRAPVEFP